MRITFLEKKPDLFNSLNQDQELKKKSLFLEVVKRKVNRALTKLKNFKIYTLLFLSYIMKIPYL